MRNKIICIKNYICVNYIEIDIGSVFDVVFEYIYYNMYHIYNVGAYNDVETYKCIISLDERKFNEYFIYLSDYRNLRLKEILNG